MRAAFLLLALLAPTADGAREGDRIDHTTAEYLAAYGKAQAYALAHIDQAVQKSCRKAIGKRPAQVIEQRCLDVSASRQTACVPADQCDALLDKVDHYCTFWRGDIPCVYPDDGGDAVMDWTKRGTWKPKRP